MSHDDSSGLKVLHVIRAPLGGLFRHVLDLANEQIARGCRVGLVADSLTGGAWADDVLRELEPRLTLGLSRTPMRRSLHPTDVLAYAHVVKRIRAIHPDIVHGHGSKGGAFARLAASRSGPEKTAYTPHGGSFNYRPGSTAHMIYMLAEKALARRTDVFLFESDFIRRRFHDYASARSYRERVIPNGIGPDELTPVVAESDPADFVYVGELRSAKGIDTLLEALAEVARRIGRAPTMLLVGSGPDEEQLIAHRDRLGLAASVSFPGRMPARRAFAKGRTLVVPSRAESLPYVVLEAAGGHVPIISTNVGGIPEIFGPFASELIACDDVPALAGAMTANLNATPQSLQQRAERLADFVASRFTIRAMVDSVLCGYRDAMSEQAAVSERPAHPSSISS